MNHNEIDQQAANVPSDTALTAEDGSLSRELVAVFKPHAPEVAVMRSLRSKLMLDSFNATANALAIVSPSSRDGRTFVAANLAIVFAELGLRTVLVDAHLETPRVHELFGIPNIRGLSAALSHGGIRETAVHRLPQFKNLSIVAGGNQPPNADDLLASESLARICGHLTSQYDIVLFDTPAGSTSSGVDWIAHQCGKVLLVVRQDHTRFEVAEAFLKRISPRAVVVGSVMNRYRQTIFGRR